MSEHYRGRILLALAMLEASIPVGLREIQVALVETTIHGWLALLEDALGMDLKHLMVLLETRLRLSALHYQTMALSLWCQSGVGAFGHSGDLGTLRRYLNADWESLFPNPPRFGAKNFWIELGGSMHHRNRGHVLRRYCTLVHQRAGRQEVLRNESH